MKNIRFDTLDAFGTLTDEMLEKVDKAVIHTALTLRDNIRKQFPVDANSTYKTHKGTIEKLADGIRVGRLVNGKLKLHAYGGSDYYDSYKTRFFVGGTTYRKAKSKNGVPSNRGRLKALNSIDKGLSGGQQMLEQNIHNALT